MGVVSGTRTGTGSFIRYSPSTVPLQQAFSFAKPRINLIQKRRKSGTVACLRQENSIDGIYCNRRRRVIIFMSLAVNLMPLISMKRAEAAEQLLAENDDIKILDPLEPRAEENPSQNPHLSVLNVLGILGSGVLAPLYLSMKKEKDDSDRTMESITAKLKESRAHITSLEKKFESDLSNVKAAGNTALAKVHDEKQSLLGEIRLANQSIANLEQDLHKERRLSEDRNIQLQQLQVSIRKSREEKIETQKQLEEKMKSVLVLEEREKLLCSDIKEKEYIIQNATSEVVEKERELSELRCAYQESQDQITSLKMEIQQLKDELLKKNNELESNNGILNQLNSELTCSRAGVEESYRKLNSLLTEYENFKLYAENKSASDAEILREKEDALEQLQEQLKVALDDVHQKGVEVIEMRKERDDIAGMLSMESKNVENLEQQFKLMQVSLEKSREETCDLTKQIQASRDLSSQLQAEISKIQADFVTARDSFQMDITQGKEREAALADELRSANEQLRKSTEAKKILSQELGLEVEKCRSLEKQLILARERQNTAALDLKKEKEIVSLLDKELKNLQAQISKDKEIVNSLETQLQEVTESMNEKASSYSRELELAKSQIACLNDEKEALQDALDEKNKAFQEARENLKEAHDAVMRIGKERESMQNRGKKLEEELASAKGEILRLKTQKSLSVNEVDYQGQEQEIEVGTIKSPVRARSARRKKVISQQEGS